MRYKLSADIIIKTENAAKPQAQRSSYLVSLISELQPVSSSFDYGCGKLRYKDVMLRTTDTLAVVDSELQLSRIQMIGSSSMSIKDITRRSNRVRAYNTKEFVHLQVLFDRAFCINVLPVIPSLLARRNVLRLIRQKLRVGGTCLFVVQYRNSDFSRMREMPNACPYLDGFLIDSLRGYSFYGLISPQKLEKMVVSAGFSIEEQRLNEGSVYLLAKRIGQSDQARIIEVDEEKNFRIITAA
jgi:hypothetical protein